MIVVLLDVQISVFNCTDLIYQVDVHARAAQDVLPVGQHHIAFGIGFHVLLIESDKVCQQLDVGFRYHYVAFGDVGIVFLIVKDLIGFKVPGDFRILDDFLCLALIAAYLPCGRQRRNHMINGQDAERSGDRQADRG